MSSAASATSTRGHASTSNWSTGGCLISWPRSGTSSNLPLLNSSLSYYAKTRCETRSAVARALSTASVHAHGTICVWCAQGIFPQSIFNFCVNDDYSFQRRRISVADYDDYFYIKRLKANTIFLSAMFYSYNSFISITTILYLR